MKTVQSLLAEMRGNPKRMLVVLGCIGVLSGGACLLIPGCSSLKSPDHLDIHYHTRPDAVPSP